MRSLYIALQTLEYSAQFNNNNKKNLIQGVKDIDVQTGVP